MTNHIGSQRYEVDDGPIPSGKPGSPVARVRDLGAAITRRRNELGLNMRDAAALCNVGTRFLFDLEHGKESVEFGKALSVAQRFGIRLRLAESLVEGS